MNDSLRALQQVELGILRQFLAICERYQLRYYMLGGSLLGAVRHQGFIPWDDDIDIGMPRPDYERFLEIAEKELQEPFEIQTTLNGKGIYSYYYARVVNKTVKLLRTKSEKDTVIPAWIDVFPLDGVPEDDRELKRWWTRGERLYKIFTFSQFRYYYVTDTVKGNHKAIKIAVKKVFYKLNLERLINTRRAWGKLDRELKKYDYETSTRLINFCGYWKMKEMFPKSVYGEGKLYPFEDLMLWGPEDADFVLTQMYGDYMTPPPDADKDHHFVEMIVGEE